MPEVARRHGAPRPVCNCVDAFDAEMAKHESNTRVSTELFSGAVLVASHKAEERKRGKPSVIIASYCPFCGAAYKREDERTAGEEVVDG